MGRLLQCLLKQTLFVSAFLFLCFSFQSFQIEQSPYLIKVDSELIRFVANSDDHESLILTNLEEGSEYQIFVAALKPSQNVSIVKINKQLSFLNSSHITFKAKESNHIEFSFDSNEFTEFYVSVIPSEEQPNLSLNKMPVLSVNSGVSDQFLVEDVFIGGGCFDVSNISFNTDPGSRGTFNNGGTNIGLDEGMILATGNIGVAVGPNNQTNAQVASGGGFDQDLFDLSGSTIYDAAIMEFDFEPTTDTVRFNYVFASEEYCEWTGNINDVFGFFLSGPGINGPFSSNSINIATLPNGQYVSINNVNHYTNASFYTSNTTPATNSSGDPDCNGHPLGSLPATDEVQFDGFTVVLEAVAVVQPCQTYHIKLAIGDAF